MKTPIDFLALTALTDFDIELSLDGAILVEAIAEGTSFDPEWQRRTVINMWALADCVPSVTGVFGKFTPVRVSFAIRSEDHAWVDALKTEIEGAS